MDIKLYPRQQRALLSPATEILYGGAVGGGKSYLARVASIIYSVKIPGLITYLFRRTFKEVLANHIHTPGGYLEMMADMIKAGDVVYSKSDFSFTFYNDSRIQLAHSQYEGDIFQHMGAQIGYLIIDEATSFTAEMTRYIRSRVRLGSLEVPEEYQGMFPRILYTANPGGVGHNYFKSGFVDHGEGEVFRAPDDDGGMLREYVPAKLHDNKVLLKNDPDYAKRVMGMGKKEMADALLQGNWNFVGGGIFSDLWEPRRHIIKPFNIPASWDMDRGYDYGSAAPAAYCTFAESNGEEFIDKRTGNTLWFPRGTLIIVGEVYFADKNYNGLRLTAGTQAARIARYEIENGWQSRIMPGPADSAIFSAEPGQTSTHAYMASQGVTFVKGDKKAGSRKMGVSLMRQRLLNSLIWPPEEPGIYIFSNCFHTIRTVPSLSRDENDKDDVDTSGEDHIWDVIRYRLLKKVTEAYETKLSGA